MSTQSYFRVSGLALVLGGLAGVVSHLVDSFFFGNTTAYANQPIHILNEFVLAAANILMLLGLSGVYGSRARGFGVTGLVGMALVFTSAVMIGVFGNLWGAMVEPWLATQAPNLANGFGPPAFFAFYNVEEAALVLGSILLAIPLLRGRVSPRWAGVPLLLSVVIGVFTFFLGVDANTLGVSLMDAVPYVLLLVALAALGYQTWAQPSPDTDIAQRTAEADRPSSSTTNFEGVR
jgi:hypothetical protein